MANNINHYTNCLNRNFEHKYLAFGKQTRLSFLNINSISANLFDIIYVYFWGLYRTPTLNGSKSLEVYMGYAHEFKIRGNKTFDQLLLVCTNTVAKWLNFSGHTMEWSSDFISQQNEVVEGNTHLLFKPNEVHVPCTWTFFVLITLGSLLMTNCEWI